MTTLTKQKEELIKKTTIVPYAWQDDGTFYPEYEKYGELWGNSKPRDNTAKEQALAYNQFKEALDSIASAAREEAERKMMWDYHEKITSLKQYLHILQTQIQAHPTEEPDELNLIESIKEKVDETFDIAQPPEWWKQALLKEKQK